MTNWWADAKNTKLAVIWGSNCAENHPGVMQWLNKAVDPVSKGGNGAKVLVMDPRKTRTAVWAEGRGGTYVPIRPGTDSAITMGLVNYMISAGSGLVDWSYLYNFTDAAFRLNSNPMTAGTGCDYARGASTAFNVDKPLYDSNGSTTGPLTGGAQFIQASAMPVVTSASSVFSYMATRASHYTPAVVADICGITVGQFNTIAAMWTDPANRPGAIFYAMGGTQHSTAGEQLHAKCMLQLMMGNLGKMGSGVNALRGIHNVQGSTDQGVLKDALPGYYTSTPSVTQTYVDFMNRQFGGTTGVGLQQLGYRNMMWWWFNQGTDPSTAQVGTYNRNVPSGMTNANHDLMPRTGAHSHIQMFQAMKAGTTTMCYVMGQNPAVTEPNLAEIRAGLSNLDTLVVQDMYLSETAAVSRKAGGITYLLPACAHPEEAGSVTSSARMLAWRTKATPAKGTSKADLEVLLRLAKALDTAGAFSHIPLNPTYGFTNRYDQLYGGLHQYNWVPTGPVSGSPANWDDAVGFNTMGQTLYQGEVVVANVYKQMCGGQARTSIASGAPSGVPLPGDFGTLWIYAGGFDAAAAGVGTTSSLRYGTNLAASAAAGTSQLIVNDNVTGGIHALTGGASAILGQYGMHGDKVANWPDGGQQTYGYDSTAGLTAGGDEEVVVVSSVASGAPGGKWYVNLSSATTKDHGVGEPLTGKGFWSYHAKDGNLAKSRATYDPGNNSLFPRYGWAWLLNRRIFYNNNPCNAATQPGSAGSGAANWGTGFPAGRTSDRYAPTYVTLCETTCPNRTAPGGNGSCKAVGDSQDVFVKPDVKATLFVHHSTDAQPIADYATLYRSYNTLPEYDYPSATTDPDWTLTNTGVYTAGQRSRFPKHWEPWESPRTDLRAKYGREGVKPTKMGGSGAYPASSAATGAASEGGAIGLPSTYPYALTTARICWHFQGGPLSRNNPWLSELDSEPYVILNAFDAGANGIADGDTVAIQTLRGTVQMKARVGVGPQSTQNVKQGVVWMPWHWGSQGLSTGASANEVCIDALDKTALIPESKACICRIYKP